jgi:tellurite resistance protein TehA-like permease
MAEDFHNPARGFGFFTFIAATNVLAAALAETGYRDVAAGLLVVSGVGWLVLGYVIPWTAVLGSRRRPMLDTANGTWFIWAVASQSVAVVAAALEPLLPTVRNELAILAVMAWSIGLVLYAACAVFVMLRAMLYPFEPEQFDPPYWVAMGAVAISVVAGARVVEMDSAPMVNVTRDLAAGTSVVLWCFATWLVPVLFAVGVWRHVVHRVPLRYEPTLWSLVFPLGMYAVAGMYLGEADQLPVVSWIGSHWFWVGLTAWVLTAGGMVHDVGRRARHISAWRSQNLARRR